ncbi:beta-lactamase regulating signal transducer with metallopeptidase domain [Lewinella aquimaris]|uniref:Beta-lactamase regulating signal transducer with metallopeptidase domain n=1 Tax=Neolewinella aquimaris TaxID=1835722 RepID=A0A840E417_9BACT|nr:M56 family metallopeptidase [Neolewinella aquimaris]MBB4080344.1 beta-lactamase regulating signal transducer with metallopeptidase domain [Neolewinella aquimaris]
MLEQFLNPALLYAAGMTILHSFWQATLLALTLWVYSRQSGSRAESRYNLGFALLVIQVLVSVWTFSTYYEPASEALVEAVVLMSPPVGTALVEPGIAAPKAWLTPNFWLSLLVVSWAVSMVAGGIRLGWSYGQVRQLAARSTSVRSTGDLAYLHQRVGRLAQRIGYRGPLRLSLSDRINGPMLVGHLKPLLLFPVALINELSTEEAETVILHELAHLRRCDHLLHPVQCMIEILFYYHPAIHWIGARVREEREHCCDDLVLLHGPGRLPYARALLYFSEHPPQIAALSLAEGGGLLARVRRFIDHQEIKYTMNSKLLLLPLLAILTLVTTAANLPAERDARMLCSLETAPAPALAAPDTLPDGTHQVTKISDGKTTRLRVEDGEIKELEIDGRTVPPTEFDQHEATAEKLLGVDERPQRSWGDGAFYFDFDSFDIDSIDTQSMHGALPMYRALSKLQDMDYGRFEFEEFSERMDTISRKLARIYPFGEGDSDGLLRIHEFDFDTLMRGKLPEIHRFRANPWGQEELRELDLRELEAHERELRDALRELEQRKRELSEEKDIRGEAMRYERTPIHEQLMEREVAHQKAAARQMREQLLAEGRRQREEYRAGTDCSEAVAHAYAYSVGNRILPTTEDVERIYIRQRDEAEPRVRIIRDVRPIRLAVPAPVSPISTCPG